MSDGGDPIHFDVPRGTVGVLSANHLAWPKDGLCIIWQWLEGELVFVVAVADDGCAAGDQWDAAQYNDYIEGWHLEEEKAMADWLVVSGRTVLNSVAPKRTIYATIQLRAAMKAFFLDKAQANRWQHQTPNNQCIRW